MRAASLEQLARECGFELAGVAPATPSPDAGFFLEWVATGMAGNMRYLTDHRADIRRDPRTLLSSARSLVCVAKVYKQADPPSHIAQYAVTRDYHEVMKEGLERLATRLKEVYGEFEYRCFVDTGPLLERTYARMAGIGWIGKNTCLINQELGSWLFLGELITSLPLDTGTPAPDRCGTCTRCVEACPTQAIVPGGQRSILDSTRCISYYTIEHRGHVPMDVRSGNGQWIFGCDICQDVCPWNRKATETDDPEFASVVNRAALEEMAGLSPDDFRARFRHTPVWRVKYSGFLRNVAIAMGNSKDPKYRSVLQQLSASEDEIIASHANWALRELEVAECA